MYVRAMRERESPPSPLFPPPLASRQLVAATSLVPYVTILLSAPPFSFSRFTHRISCDATRCACPKNSHSFDLGYLPPPFLPHLATLPLLPPSLPSPLTLSLSRSISPPFPPPRWSSRVERSFPSSFFCRFTPRCVLGVYVSPKNLALLTRPQSPSFSLILTSSFSLLYWYYIS